VTSEETDYPKPQAFTASAAVFAQRDGKILILKRAGGEMSGAWYIPGGMIDEGEWPEQAASRELLEESGLVPSGPLTQIGLVPMDVYGSYSLEVTYAADCEDGEVAVSDEHEGHRWIDPREFRDRYFGDEQLQRVTEGSERRAMIVRGIRANLDRYIDWLDRQG
jgi:8-oxo-dGTP pyrophosphatase MutT (NUDIX family)